MQRFLSGDSVSDWFGKSEASISPRDPGSEIIARACIHILLILLPSLHTHNARAVHIAVMRKPKYNRTRVTQNSWEDPADQTAGRWSLGKTPVDQLTVVIRICQLCSMTNTCEKYERTQQRTVGKTWLTKQLDAGLMGRPSRLPYSTD